MNGRIYPKHVLEKAVADFREKTPAVGFFDHLGASHVVRDLRVEGDNKIVADIEMIGPYKDTLERLVARGEASLSVCGVGTACGNTITEFTLKSVDLIANGKFKEPPDVITVLARLDRRTEDQAGGHFDKDGARTSGEDVRR